MPIVVKCPFFKKEKGLCTSCEGGSIKHPDREARNNYMYTYCADILGWHKCTVAASLEKYYERL